MSHRPASVPCPEGQLEACLHRIAVLELEKAQCKLRAKALALRLSRLEVLYKRAKEAGYAF